MSMEDHLGYLVDQVGCRQAGTDANRRATDYLIGVLARTGLEVVSHPFRTRWWEPGPGELRVGGRRRVVTPNPFSAPCHVTAPVVRCDDAERVSAVTAAPLDDAVLVLAGSAAEPVMPRSFPFYNPTEARRRTERIERSRPLAVVALSDTFRWMPTFGDPDLAFPSVTVPTAWGRELSGGTMVSLHLEGSNHIGEGVNVAARSGVGRRVVVSAHVDTAAMTPGALDNAGSVAALLTWAERGLPPAVNVELVFFNGEDHFDAPGEQAWLADTDLADVMLVVNLDGAGATGRRSSVVALACPAHVERTLHEHARSAGLLLDDPWFESDHAIFALQGVPSVAITSEGAHELFATIAHTPRDSRDQVDTATLSRLIDFLETAVPALASAVAEPV